MSFNGNYDPYPPGYGRRPGYYVDQAWREVQRDEVLTRLKMVEAQVAEAIRPVPRRVYRPGELCGVCQKAPVEVKGMCYPWYGHDRYLRRKAQKER